MAPLAFFNRHACSDFPPQHSYECAQPRASLAISFSAVQRTNTSSRCNKSNKKVSFNRRVTYSQIIHLNNYTTEEIKACWFDGEEFHVMKTDARIAAARLVETGSIAAGSNNDDNMQCGRGLESYVRSTRMLKRGNRMVARWEVLEEQELQFQQRRIDLERIAKIYEAASAAALAQARETGVKDELQQMSTI
jgi:hypothetical protein